MSLSNMKERALAVASEAAPEVKPQPHYIEIEGGRKTRYSVGKVIDKDVFKTGTTDSGSEWTLYQVSIKAINGNGIHVVKFFGDDLYNMVIEGKFVVSIESKSAAKDQLKAFYNFLNIEMLDDKEAAVAIDKECQGFITNVADLRKADSLNTPAEAPSVAPPAAPVADLPKNTRKAKTI